MKPILFSAPMVRAINAGTKTQTRRVVKPTSGPHSVAEVIRTPDSLAAFIRHHCPYGQPGDRLWVRESVWVDATTKEFKWYVSDVFTPDRKRDYCKLKPAIHMRRSESRITLEITGVRVERLQEISDDDAVAEGIERVGGETSCTPWRNYDTPFNAAFVCNCAAPTTSFRSLWESISGPGSWEANPFVWVVEFRKVEE